MIRSYTVNELEERSGITRRTISDYISKGVMAGPSHRGRGARYPQKDLDVLMVLPRLRTLLKREYPTLKSASRFLEHLSVRDLNRLATRTTEDTFVAEVRRLRVRNTLMELLPYVAPEKIEEILASLTPGQVRGVDSGRYQIGAVLDIEALLAADNQAQRANALNGTNGNGLNGHAVNGHAVNGHPTAERGEAATNGSGAELPFWSVNWLNGHEEDSGIGAALSQADVGSVQEAVLRMEEKMAATASGLRELSPSEDTQPDLPALDEKLVATSTVEERLTEIAQRLQKLESILKGAQ